MCMEKDRSSIVGFALAGLALGAAAWYLFGTKEGRENFDRAVEGINEVSSKLQKKAKEGMEYASDLADKAQDKFHDISEDAKRKGKEVIDDAHDLANRAADRASDLTDTAKSKLNKHTS